MTLSPAHFLDPIDLPVPQDRPFTLRQIADLGISRRQLYLWLGVGLLVSPLRGVYYVASLADSLELRVMCLRLVLPRDAVVCDRTAGWLLGAPMILAPGDHLLVPRAAVFCPPGNRLRNGLVASGERTFADDDLIDVGGILVTKHLRTACDLGRMLHRDQAFAALDSLLRLGVFTLGELVAAVERYKGFRGVRQLRALAPDADGRAESPGESILRRRWLDCLDLPRPDLQIEVEGPHGVCFLDLGLPDLRYAAEYDGAEWHGEAQRVHDRERRSGIAEQGAWIIDPLRAHNIHGFDQDAEQILRGGVRRALEARRVRYL
jgi:hypothetical protein